MEEAASSVFGDNVKNVHTVGIVASGVDQIPDLKNVQQQIDAREKETSKVYEQKGIASLEQRVLAPDGRYVSASDPEFQKLTNNHNNKRQIMVETDLNLSKKKVEKAGGVLVGKNKVVFPGISGDHLDSLPDMHDFQAKKRK